MLLGEFHTLVRTTAKRLNSLDDLIPIATRQAARYIERNYTLQYMNRFVTFPLAADTDCIPFPSSRLKKFNFVRITQDDGCYDYLTMKDPQEISRLGECQPKHFWLDAYDHMFFDSAADVDYSVGMSFVEFSLWPTDDLATHWLLDHADDVLLARTIIGMAPQMRDPEMITNYGKLLDLGLKSLQDSELELHDGPTRMEKMNYGKDMA